MDNLGKQRGGLIPQHLWQHALRPTCVWSVCCSTVDFRQLESHVACKRRRNGCTFCPMTAIRCIV